jgi:hypothetical protein
VLLTLDDPEALEPSQTGAKAAWLARARQAGLPVLPGVVVTAGHSQRFLQAGADALATSGSGRARMVITGTILPDRLREELTLSTASMAAPLVVRSSSVLEGSGEWSGAFTSYLDIRHEELPKAVVGCYASAFTQATVERFEAAGVDPRRADLAVLIQPALDPQFGGTARLVGEDAFIVGVKGSPVPLVQGWDPGVQAKVTSAGTIHGASAIETLGEDVIRSVDEALRHAQQTIGANNCEWAVADGQVWVLQAQRFAEQASGEGIAIADALRTDEAADLGRLIRRYPGPLAEQLVLPWAIGAPDLADLEVPAVDVDPLDALQAAAAHAASLTAEVWSRPKPVAAVRGRDTLRELRGTDPAVGLSLIAGLRRPDLDQAREVLGLLATVRRGLVDAGAVAHASSGWHVAEEAARVWLSRRGDSASTTRIGFDRWEPFNAALVAAHGTSVAGVSAGSGIAFGRMCVVTDPGKAAHFRPRDVVVAVHPVPGLAALLFDAAALITTGGGPAAHLFESARSLGIPALCATRIEDLVDSELDQIDHPWALAVDGVAGVVHGVPW